jgi:hypothetical protein
MFETLTNTNRTTVLFGSVRCGAELEQTEHDFENVLFCLFVRLAISGTLLWTVGLSLSNGHILGNQTVLRLPNCGFSGCRPDFSGRPKLDSISAINNISVSESAVQS